MATEVFKVVTIICYFAVKQTNNSVHQGNDVLIPSKLALAAFVRVIAIVCLVKPLSVKVQWAGEWALSEAQWNLYQPKISDSTGLE